MMAGRWILTLCLLGLAGNAGGHYQKTFWAGDCLLTLYSLSRNYLHQGNNRLGLRVQNRDYLILDRLPSPSLSVQAGRSEQRVSLHPGPGRDYRGSVFFPKPGKYVLKIQITMPDGGKIVFRRQVKVAGPPDGMTAAF